MSQEEQQPKPTNETFTVNPDIHIVMSFEMGEALVNELKRVPGRLSKSVWCFLKQLEGYVYEDGYYEDEREEAA